MMDNDNRGRYDNGTKIIIFFIKEIIFNNIVMQLKKCCYGMNVIPPLLSTKLYMYFVKN
jgi:hypothetical protein